MLSALNVVISSKYACMCIANALLEREVPYELNAILASLVPDGYKIGVKWVVQTDTGILDVSWG